MFPKVYVVKCRLGNGLRATHDLERGEELFTCEGPLISLRDVLTKGEAGANPIQIGPTTYIDVGTPGVFINHSCDPNAGLVNDRHMVALRPISKDEDVCFDYSTTMSEELWTMICRCGRPNCRGLIQDFHHLPPHLQVHYLALQVVQKFIVEEARARLSPVEWDRAHDLQAKEKLVLSTAA